MKNMQLVLEEFDALPKDEQLEFEEEIHRRRIAMRRSEIRKENIEQLSRIQTGDKVTGSASDLFKAIDNASDME